MERNKIHHAPLLPNTTYIMQPCDTNFNGPLKKGLRKERAKNIIEGHEIYMNNLLVCQSTGAVPPPYEVPVPTVAQNVNKVIN